MKIDQDKRPVYLSDLLNALYRIVPKEMLNLAAWDSTPQVSPSGGFDETINPVRSERSERSGGGNLNSPREAVGVDSKITELMLMFKALNLNAEIRINNVSPSKS